VLTIRNHNASEGGGIGRRAGFRLQDQNAKSPLFLSETRPGPRPEDVRECPQWTHFGHGDRNEKGAVALSDVQRAAAALLHRVADGGEIPIEVLRGFAELVLRSELVELSRQVLGGPPEFAVRRALELASLVLGVRVVDDAEKGKGRRRASREMVARVSKPDSGVGRLSNIEMSRRAWVQAGFRSPRPRRIISTKLDGTGPIQPLGAPFNTRPVVSNGHRR